MESVPGLRLEKHQKPFYSGQHESANTARLGLTKKVTEPTPYREAFPTGTEVRIADEAFLRYFTATWKYHHRLQPEQLPYADRVTKVEEVAFYHGGDPVYKLAGVPGLWLEQCLRPVSRDN